MSSLLLSIIVFINVVLLCILVPGGPVENRDFSNLKGAIFWGFNIFLTSLGLFSFFTIYLILIDFSNVQMITMFIAICFIVVYAIDLMGIFPKSPTKMSKSLLSFEIINLCVGVYLLIYSIAYL